MDNSSGVELKSSISPEKENLDFFDFLPDINIFSSQTPLALPCWI